MTSGDFWQSRGTDPRLRPAPRLPRGSRRRRLSPRGRLPRGRRDGLRCKPGAAAQKARRRHRLCGPTEIV
jgi:hypothetical protein